MATNASRINWNEEPNRVSVRPFASDGRTAVSDRRGRFLRVVSPDPTSHYRHYVISARSRMLSFDFPPTPPIPIRPRLPFTLRRLRRTPLIPSGCSAPPKLISVAWLQARHKAHSHNAHAHAILVSGGRWFNRAWGGSDKDAKGFWANARIRVLVR